MERKDERTGRHTDGIDPVANMAIPVPLEAQAEVIERKPAKSAFVTGTRVIYKTRGRGVRGQVVGPDQDYFPSPAEVFVSFPSTGFTLLLPVTALELAEVES